MRADIQRTLLGFQEVKAPLYRCVVDLMKLKRLLFQWKTNPALTQAPYSWHSKSQLQASLKTLP